MSLKIGLVAGETQTVFSGRQRITGDECAVKFLMR